MATINSIKIDKKIAIFTFVSLVFFSVNVHGKKKTVTTPDFKVQYEDSTECYAMAGLKILEVVKRSALEMGFVFPKRIEFRLIPSRRNILFVAKDNPNLITWEYKSMNDFLAPPKSGYNVVYGLCHEMGHVCMFNINPNKNNWMTVGYREGWAHYFGCLMLDLVDSVLGNDVWPEKYDIQQYSNIHNFTQALESKETWDKSFIASSLFWYSLSNKIGRNNIGSFFQSIQFEKIRNPDANKKFIAQLQRQGLDAEFLKEFAENSQYLIITQ